MCSMKLASPGQAQCERTSDMNVCEKEIVPAAPPSLSGNTIEVSVKGKWIRVPALEVNGKTLVVKGKWVKAASVHDEEWLETELEDPETCVKRLKARDGLPADIFTFAQKLPATQPRYSYPVEWDSIAAVHLTSFKEWWEKLPQETRKNVRRSQKRGVTVRVREFDDELVREIIDVNADAPVRQGVQNHHYGKSFEQTRKDYSAFVDRSDFICAYVGDELIGFLKMVRRGNIASILNITPKPSHYDKRPTNALIAKALELCEAKGISYFVYGRFNYGNKQQSPLREFKIRNGFEEILMPRYCVPLTSWGALCMKLKIHHGLLGILPHSVITFAVNARTKWYNLKKV
jgi:hypothetical protein